MMYLTHPTPNSLPPAGQVARSLRPPPTMLRVAQVPRFWGPGIRSRAAGKRRTVSIWNFQVGETTNPSPARKKKSQSALPFLHRITARWRTIKVVSGMELNQSLSPSKEPHAQPAHNPPRRTVNESRKSAATSAECAGYQQIPHSPPSFFLVSAGETVELSLTNPKSNTYKHPLHGSTETVNQ
jgi:hypothetical protein